MKKEPTETQILAKAEQARLNRLYSDVLGADGAVEILEDLERHFELKSMIKRGSDGRVDQFATIANNGAYEVISFIKQRIQKGALGQ